MRSVSNLALLFVALNAHAQLPSYVPVNGLISWYPFNDNANDESGNGNDGTVSGAQSTVNRVGTSNSAYAFNGSDSYINLSGNTGIVSDFSLSFWMRPVNTLDGYLIDRDICNAGNDWAIYWANNGQINLRYGMNGPDYFIQGVSASVGAWHHAVAVRDISTNELRLYVDGQLAGSVSFPAGNFNNTGLPIMVGESNCLPGVNPNFQGDIDDIGIWGRVLSLSEIEGLFNGLGPCLSPTTPSMSGLSTSYLTSDPSVTLTGTPANGIFIGPGISESTFNPSVAGAGAHTIIYTYVDENGCVNSTGMCTSVALGIGIDEEDYGTLTGVRIYPNPAAGRFNLELDMDGQVSLVVYDNQGRQLKNQMFVANGPGSLHILDLSKEAIGSYSLQLSTPKGTMHQTLVVE